MAISYLAIDEIVVGDRLRPISRETVERLKESISRLGEIKVPLSVRFLSLDDGWELVAGMHRLQAATELGMKEVPVREEKGSELDARLWEIAENLHRAELTVDERAHHIAEWIRLVEERDKLAQLAPVSVRGRTEGRGNQGGINAASRELGIDRTEAQRAIKIDALAPEAKAEARVLNLHDNQTVLLKSARQTTKEEQLRVLREEAARKAARKDDVSASERRIEAAVNATKRLSAEELLVFADWFDAYREDGGATVFDQTAVGKRG